MSIVKPYTNDTFFSFVCNPLLNIKVNVRGRVETDRSQKVWVTFTVKVEFRKELDDQFSIVREYRETHGKGTLWRQKDGPNINEFIRKGCPDICRNLISRSKSLKDSTFNFMMLGYETSHTKTSGWLDQVSVRNRNLVNML